MNDFTRVLYVTEDNASNYLVIRDMSRGEDDTAVIDWDVSDDQIRAAAENLDSIPEPESWQPFGEIIASMTGYQTADSYVKDLEV